MVNKFRFGWFLLFAILLVACQKNSRIERQDPEGDEAQTQVVSVPLAPPGHLLGSVCGFNALTRSGGFPSPSGNTIFNLPLFKSSGVEDDWWDNLVEEIAYSGQDYIAMNIRGKIPSFPDIDAGDPTRLPKLIAAMDRRGVSHSFKVALFDDCPASWTANRNKDNGQGYGADPKFDCADTNNYKYIWDYNIKIALQNIPVDRRLEIQNRPVIFFWSVKPAWMTNIGSGNLKKIAQHIRQKCQEVFQVDPYLVVDASWLQNDPATNDPSVVDAVHNWFTMANHWTITTFNGVKTGSSLPGFYVVQGTTNMQIDANHGIELAGNLQNIYNQNASMTLLEGFTDCAENAALWRSKDTVYYDYPNQRLNILRKFSGNPYPDTLKVEAEACDSYSDETIGNSGGTFREGNLDIAKVVDALQGWKVMNTQANEWLEWKQLPLINNVQFHIRYNSANDCAFQFIVNGTPLPVKALPATNGIWTTRNCGTYTAATQMEGDVRLKIISGNPEINYFKMTHN